MATSPRKQQAQFIQRRLARRVGASSLTRLSDQFQGQIQDLTSQYETEFSRYQQQVNEVMGRFQQQSAVYESAFNAYRRDVLEPYQVQLSNFQSSAQSYQQRLADLAAGRLDQILPFGYSGKDYWVTLPSGQRVTSSQFRATPEQFGFSEVLPNDYGRGRIGARPLAGPAPVAPERPRAFEMEEPTAPKIDEFDSRQFDQRRSQLQEGFQREVAERKGARLNAVRRSSRTMLSGAQ